MIFFFQLDTNFLSKICKESINDNESSVRIRVGKRDTKGHVLLEKMKMKSIQTFMLMFYVSKYLLDKTIMADKYAERKICSTQISSRDGSRENVLYSKLIMFLALA
jgi:hypothetical protein